MDDLATYLYDLLQNSIAAKSKTIELSMIEDLNLTIIIKDDGKGIDEKDINHVTSPFYTTRTTRKVGLGLSFIKMLTEQTDGTFRIESKKNEGTILELSFNQHHIDMPQIGDIGELIYMMSVHQDVNEFIFTYRKYDEKFIYQLTTIKPMFGQSLYQSEIRLGLIDWISHEIKNIRGEQ